MFYITIHKDETQNPTEFETKTIKKLHYFFVNNSATYAISPKLKKMHVFTDNEEDIIKLKNFINVDNHSYVPKDYKGKWSLFLRYKIPTRKTDSNSVIKHRVKRVTYSNDTNMKHFYIKSSKQNMSSFIKYFYIEEVFNDKPNDDTKIGTNGYGLSTKTQHYYVPRF